MPSERRLESSLSETGRGTAVFSREALVTVASTGDTETVLGTVVQTGGFETCKDVGVGRVRVVLVEVVRVHLVLVLIFLGQQFLLVLVGPHVVPGELQLSELLFL